METFQSIRTLERDNMISQSVESLNNDNVFANEVEKFDNNYNDTKIRELTQEFDSITIDEDVINSVALQEENVIDQERASFRANDR